MQTKQISAKSFLIWSKIALHAAREKAAKQLQTLQPSSIIIAILDYLKQRHTLQTF